MLLHPNSILKVQKEFVSSRYNIFDIDAVFFNNINFNYDVTSHLISRVTIFYSKQNGKQICALKILENESDFTKYCEYKKFVEATNAVFCRTYFWPLELIQLNGLNFILLEFIEAETFEEMLKGAILSPSKNVGKLKIVLDLQCRQLSEFFAKCEECSNSAFFDLENVKNELKKMISLYIPKYSDNTPQNKLFNYAKSIFLKQGFVVPDLVNPNIFEGPIFIDNTFDNLNWIQNNLPVILNRYRYILLSIMSPPISSICIGIIPTLLLISDNSECDILIINCYRNLLPCGFTQEEHIVFFYLSFLYEISERCRLFCSSPDMLGILCEQLIDFENALSRVDFFKHDFAYLAMLDNQKIIDSQNNIVYKSFPYSTFFDIAKNDSFESSLLQQTSSVKLLFENINSFNIVSYDKHYLAIRQSVGPVDFSKCKYSFFEDIIKNGDCYICKDINKILLKVLFPAININFLKSKMMKFISRCFNISFRRK